MTTMTRASSIMKGTTTMITTIKYQMCQTVTLTAARRRIVQKIRICGSCGNLRDEFDEARKVKKFRKKMDEGERGGMI